jgi:hypothetical protein
VDTVIRDHDSGIRALLEWVGDFVQERSPCRWLGQLLIEDLFALLAKRFIELLQ